MDFTDILDAVYTFFGGNCIIHRKIIER